MRSGLVIVAVVSACVVVGAGCVPGGGFACEDDGQCVSDGVQGACEAVGYCSFPDPSCAGGRRFGERAPSELAGACVEGDGIDVDAATPTADAAPIPPVDAGGAGDASSGEPDGSTPPGDAGPLEDVVVSFGEGDGTSFTGVTRDGWIEEATPGANHGGGNQLYAQADPLQHATLRFELAAVPPTAIVTAAELLVHTPNGTPPAGAIELYALLEDWTEGALDGETGAASWNERAAGTPWATAGAGTPGSRAAAPFTSFAPTTSGTAYTIDVPTEIVQAWVASPETNRGLIFVAVGAGAKVRLGSCQGAVSRRPKLTVTYH